GPEMLAGMIPTLDCSGLIRPGQFGPTTRVVPASWAYVKNSAVSFTGMPSVITTASGSLASTASTTADLVNFAGTKMTVTSAPVASTASATELKTGTLTPPSNSTDCPPLPGVTPPTMLVPEVSIRWVCFLPSEPVMPWTMTLESAVRKIAMSGGRLSVSVGGGRSRLGGAPRGAVHGFRDGDEGVGVVGQELAALLHPVAVHRRD